MDPKVSVVTISYNAQEEIEKTLESVLYLEYSDYEYIIVDGKSIDNTTAIIESFISKFKEKQVYVNYVSEKDKGIYDAMNKGIDKARGEWIIFMNAGDVFSNDKVLKDLFEKNDFSDVDVVYGNSYSIINGERKLRVPHDIDKMYFYMVLCHQATLVKTEICRKIKFDMKYKIAADYKMFLYLYINNYRFRYVNMIIADFNTDGVSSIHPIKAHLEDLRVRREVIKKDKFILYRIVGELYVFICRCVEALKYRK